MTAIIENAERARTTNMPTDEAKNIELRELAPCPFCGKPMEIFEDEGGFYYGSCSMCAFDTSHSWPNRESLVQFLNSRPAPSPAPQTTEAGDAVKGVVELPRILEALKPIQEELDEKTVGYDLADGSWNEDAVFEISLTVKEINALRLALSAPSPVDRGAVGNEQIKLSARDSEIFLKDEDSPPSEKLMEAARRNRDLLTGPPAVANEARLKEAREHIGKLLAAMAHWGKQEDGVPTDCWVQFKAAEDFFLATLPPSILPKWTPASSPADVARDEGQG